MLRRRIAWLAVLGAVFCLAVPQPARAQIGGFIKKKVKQAVKGQVTGDSAAGATAAAPSGPRFSEYVLELTPENLDKFQQGLAAEKVFRDSVEAVYAKMMTPEQYQQCRMNAMTSPEGQAIAKTDMSNLQAAQEAGQKLLALAEKRCGPDPGGRNKGVDMQGTYKRGAEAAGFTGSQYAIIKERVKPFCGAGGGTAKIAGSGSGIYYVYTDGEMAALQPRCEKLMAMIDTKPRPAGKQMKP